MTTKGATYLALALIPSGVVAITLSVWAGLALAFVIGLLTWAFVRRRASLWRARTGASPALTHYRATGGEAAVVFIHGFGAEKNPFGRFPHLLTKEPALDGWDVHALRYNTAFLPDAWGIWPPDPSIGLLATYLRSRARLDPLGRYGAVALVAHSMGGLVVQHALLDDPEFADRVSHVFLFGTPSAGTRVANWGGFWKQQVGEMTPDGEFIGSLRRRWGEVYGKVRPFDLWVVAGDRDVLVPPTSSLDPFPEETHLVVPGGHLEIVHLKDRGSMSQQVVLEGLIGNAAPAGPWNSARVAVERHQFDRAVRQLLPNAAELDERHLVDLALALEGTGRREEAIGVLRDHAGKHGTDAQGALAGRLKRNWQAEGRREDGASALQLYSESLGAAISSEDHEQAYYHAINLAFLELTYRGDRSAARDAADTALEHCRMAPPNHWRSATEGEAYLYREEWERAIDAYVEAVALQPTPHELESTYVQASRVIAELRRPDLKARLDAVFRGPPAILDAAGAAGETRGPG